MPRHQSCSKAFDEEYGGWCVPALALQTEMEFAKPRGLVVSRAGVLDRAVFLVFL
jgi:hypothetical protein